LQAYSLSPQTMLHSAVTDQSKSLLQMERL
jgi:hypothetical protein